MRSGENTECTLTLRYGISCTETARCFPNSSIHSLFEGFPCQTQYLGRTSSLFRVFSAVRSLFAGSGWAQTDMTAF